MKEKIKNINEKIARVYKIATTWLNGFLHRRILIIAMVVMTILAFVIRYLVALFPTSDVTAFVFVWMKSIKSMGFSNFYKVDADYSPLYLFIIGLLTLFPQGEEVTVGSSVFYANWMYYLKSVFFLMDFLIAFGMYLIVKLVTQDKVKAALCYIITLFLPVQFTNTALWGNSDSMYFCCFVYAIYFLLKNKDRWTFFFVGLSLALKLQSVFFLPFLVLMICKRKAKFIHIYMSILAIFLAFLPAYCCGASFSEPFAFYGKELSGYSNLTLGCANIWHLVDYSSATTAIVNKGSTLFGLACIGVFFILIFIRNPDLSDENIIGIAAFLIGIVPFFLPHMHERYFYSLDVLTLLYAFTCRKKRFYLPLLMQLSSGIAYYHYMSGFHKYFIEAWGEDSVNIAVFINIFVLAVLLFDIYHMDHTKTTKDVADREKGDLQVLLSENKKASQENVTQESAK